MERLTQLLVVLSLLLASPAAAQQVTPHYLPEGQVLEIDGEDHIAYDFEQFRELLELDERLYFSVTEIQALRDELQLILSYEETARASFAETLALYQTVAGAYEEAEAALGVCLRDQEELNSLLRSATSGGRRFQLIHPLHTPIEAALVAVIVTLLVLR